jgi:ribokinase
MIGRLGTDPFAEPFLETLACDGIESRYIVRDSDRGTGVASPLIECDGLNRIVMIPRADRRLAPSDIEAAAPALHAADVVLLQFETPTNASERAAQIAREAVAFIILNPAPARHIANTLWALSDILVPHEIQLAMVSGCPAANSLGGARSLLGRGPRAVVVTLGEEAALLATTQSEERFAAHEVEEVDSVAAGDASVGTRRLPVRGCSSS